MKSKKTAAILLSYALVGAEAISGILLTVILLKNLGQMQYGIYKLAASWVSLVSVLDFGLGGTITRYVIKYRVDSDVEGERKFLGIAFAVYTALVFMMLGIGAVIGLLIPRLISDDMTAHIREFRFVFLILVVKSCVVFFNHAFTGRFSAEERFVYIKSIALFNIISRVLLCYVIMPFVSSPCTIAVIDLALALVQVACHIWATRALGMEPVRFCGWDGKLFREIFRYTSAVFVASAVNQFNGNVDNIVLGAFGAVAVVGLYASITQIYTIYGAISTAIQSIYLPQISRTVFSQKSDLKNTESLVQPSRLQLIVLFFALACFVHFGDEFLALWLGDSYSAVELRDAHQVGMLLLFSATWHLFQNSATSILKAKNLLHGKIWITAAATAVNFLITVLLVPRYGMLGAALGTAVSLIFGYGIAANIYFSRVAGIQLKLYYQKVLYRFWYGLPCVFLIGFAVDRIPGEGVAVFCIKALVYFAIYAGAIVFGCLTGEEKDLLKKRIVRH